MMKDFDNIFIKDFDYNLPQHCIAAYPLQERDKSKLLIAEKGILTEDVFRNLHLYLPQNATLVLNNTKVIEARIFFQKTTGGMIEIFCLEPFNTADVTQVMLQKGNALWHCIIGGASKWNPGLVLQKAIHIQNEVITLTARCIKKEEESFVIEFTWTSNHTFGEMLGIAGVIPLPPYIKRKTNEEDRERYQTVFAEHQGSVAAPTAALHFTGPVFHTLSKKNIQPSYITLHVGAGTFKPVKSETITGHQMHGENFSVSKTLLQQLIHAETIIVVGTTSLRTLESLYWLGVKLKNNPKTDFTLSQWEAYDLKQHSLTYKESLSLLLDYLERTGKENLVCRTSLLIRPGYNFKSAVALITNFHQPRSTLLLLVAAFIGKDWKKMYDYALEKDYRFLSYGDSSLLWRY
jgi:S-adenosylmethionine:tRNA ribosyltransferase-isomerase